MKTMHHNEEEIRTLGIPNINTTLTTSGTLDIDDSLGGLLANATANKVSYDTLTGNYAHTQQSSFSVKDMCPQTRALTSYIRNKLGHDRCDVTQWTTNYSLDGDVESTDVVEVTAIERSKVGFNTHTVTIKLSVKRDVFERMVALESIGA